jgi:Fe(3+) dicitrate transport protein
MFRSSAPAPRHLAVLALCFSLSMRPSALAQDAPATPAPPVAPAPGEPPPAAPPPSEPAAPAPGAPAPAEAPPAESPAQAPGGEGDAGMPLDPAPPIEVPPAEPPVPPAPAVPVAEEPPPAPISDPAPPVASELPAAPSDEKVEEVIVVGTRVARTPGAVHLVREKDLERFEYDDPTTVLQAVPGVYSRTEDGMGLRPNIGLRGANPDRSKKVTLMEDGVLFGPAPYSAPAAYYFPTITRMTQVRVIKGPASVAAGPQTVGGALDLVTRSVPDEASGALDLAFGQYGYGKGHGHFGASTDQFGFVVEGLHLRNTGFKELPGGGDTGVARNEWMGKFRYVVDPTADVLNELELKLTYSDEVSNETYLGLTEADFEDDPYQRYGATSLDRMKNHRFAAALTHRVELRPRMSLTTTAYRNVFSRLWRRVDRFTSGAPIFDVLANPESGANGQTVDALHGEAALPPGSALQLAGNNRDFVSEGVQTLFRWDIDGTNLAHRLEAGLRVHYDRIERRHSAENFELVEGEPYPNSTPTTITAFNKGATYAVALHAVYALTWERLTVTPGVRAELMRMSFVNRATGEGDKGFQYALLPGLGTYTELTDELGIVAGAYRGFSPTPPENIEDAEPEYSVNYELGPRYTDGLLRAEALGFFNDYSNLTNYCTASGGGCSAAMLDMQSSAGRARIYGVEAQAAHDIPAGRFKIPVLVSYTYTRAEFGESFRSADPSWGVVDAGDPVPYVPEHQLRAQAGVDHKRAGGMLGFSYVAAMAEGSVGVGAERRELTTDAQYLLDASAWVVVWGPLKLYATGQNLLDSVYLVSRRPFGARPNAPRWIHAGLKVEL